MRAIGQHIKGKAITMFLRGDTYDDISSKLGIAKGSVVNIISDFREGKLALPPGNVEYVDSLRKLAVDLRNAKVTIDQSMGCIKVHNKIQGLGVELEEIEGWIDVSRELTSAESGKDFVKAAIDLTHVRGDKGLSYSEIVKDYRDKTKMLEDITAEIARNTNTLDKLREEEGKVRLSLEEVGRRLTQEKQKCQERKQEIDEELECHLNSNKLSWKLIRMVEAVIDSSFRSTGLKEEDIAKLSDRIIEVGSLQQFVDNLKKTRVLFENEIKPLIENHACAFSELRKLIMECEEVEKEIKTRWVEVKKLDSELFSKTEEINRLTKTIHANRERIYLANSILSFLFAPNSLSEDQLNRLVGMFIALRKIRLGIGPKITLDTNGNVLCKCDIPGDLGGEDLKCIDGNKVREALAIAIAPMVDDMFVPRIIHEIALTGRPVNSGSKEIGEIVRKITKGTVE